MPKTAIALIAILIMLVLGCVSSRFTPAADAKPLAADAIRVGTYDSRAIAVAFVHSRWGNERYEAKKKEMDKAKAAGDTEKIAELKAWGKAQQHKKHLQGFSTAPVHEYLEKVKKDLPKVAKTANVDVIVSKWEFDYQRKKIKTVDVTDAIVKLYDPSEKTLKTIEQLRKHKPVTEEDLLKHPH
jgi:hypothetical protein